MRTCKARRCSKPVRGRRRDAVYCSVACSSSEMQYRQADRLSWRLRDMGFAGVDVQLEPGPMGTGAGAEMREMEG